MGRTREESAHLLLHHHPSWASFFLFFFRGLLLFKKIKKKKNKTNTGPVKTPHLLPLLLDCVCQKKKHSSSTAALFFSVLLLHPPSLQHLLFLCVLLVCLANSSQDSRFKQGGGGGGKRRKHSHPKRLGLALKLVLNWFSIQRNAPNGTRHKITDGQLRKKDFSETQWLWINVRATCCFYFFFFFLFFWKRNLKTRDLTSKYTRSGLINHSKPDIKTRFKMRCKDMQLLVQSHALWLSSDVAVVSNIKLRCAIQG